MRRTIRYIVQLHLAAIENGSIMGLKVELEVTLSDSQDKITLHVTDEKLVVVRLSPGLRAAFIEKLRKRLDDDPSEDVVDRKLRELIVETSSPTKEGANDLIFGSEISLFLPSSPLYPKNRLSAGDVVENVTARVYFKPRSVREPRL